MHHADKILQVCASIAGDGSAVAQPELHIFARFVSKVKAHISAFLLDLADHRNEGEMFRLFSIDRLRG